jgi:hypothetical protein
MSRPIRCRICGTLFTLEPFDVVARWRRPCPRCRGPLPPTGGVLSSDVVVPLPAGILPEVAP